MFLEYDWLIQWHHHQSLHYSSSLHLHTKLTLHTNTQNTQAHLTHNSHKTHLTHKHTLHTSTPYTQAHLTHKHTLHTSTPYTQAHLTHNSHKTHLTHKHTLHTSTPYTQLTQNTRAHKAHTTHRYAKQITNLPHKNSDLIFLASPYTSANPQRGLSVGKCDQPTPRSSPSIKYLSSPCLLTVQLTVWPTLRLSKLKSTLFSCPLWCTVLAESIQ